MNANSPRKRLWIALPAALIAGFLNVFLFFLFMVLYGHVIDPGHEESFYQEAADRFGPYASIIGGMPVMFAIGMLLRRSFGSSALTIGLFAWLIYLIVDLTVIVALGQFTSFLPLIVVSFATKLAAVYLGARPRSGEINSDHR